MRAKVFLLILIVSVEILPPRPVSWVRLLDYPQSGNPNSKTKNGVRKVFSAVAIMAAAAVAWGTIAEAQQTKLYRFGIIHQGGPYYRAIEGLRDGLRELSYEEGKHFAVEIRDTKGDLKAVEEAARSFERERLNLIYTLAGSVTTAAKRVTADIPIVFAVGSDPTVLGLVESIANPGGRLTGVHFLLTDLTGKRLEVLKEILPKVKQVVTFYNPSNRGANEAAKIAREAAAAFGIRVVERHVGSVEDLQRGLQALKVGEVDAYFFTSDAMVASQAQLIIDTARAKRLPTMFHEGSLVSQGGLASYGLSFHEIGRMSAKYVQRVLTGTHPRELPVEAVHKLELIINLKAAKALGITISPSVLYRADKVIR
jgi:putative ABC transport system substrate-binding protein